MGKISTLILHNLKKAKGQYVSFGIIICLTAFITNIALVLAFQTSDAYDARFDELKTANVNFFVSTMQDSDELIDDVKDLNGVKDVERHEGIFLEATVKDFNNSDFKMNTVFYNIDSARSLNIIDVSEKTDEKLENPIYISLYMSKLGGFNVGDKFTYEIGEETYTFNVVGIAEEMQYGNYGTGIAGAYLPEEGYKEFEEEFEGRLVAEYSIVTEKLSDYTAIKKSVSKMLEDKGIALLSIKDEATGKESRTMVCNLIIMIFLAFAFIILFVSIFLSNFRIRNTIEVEMNEMGVLKALGYTSQMIIASTVAPYTAVGAVSAILGAGLSYLVLPTVADILAVQSGFSFAPSFDILAVLIAVLFPVLIIWLFAYIAAKKIRGLEPINAIRGITESKGGKNYFPLDKTKGSINVAIILKQTANQIGQNILLFAVAFGIMILLSFAGTMFYNVNIKSDNFMNTLSEETPSVVFTAKEGKTEELMKILEGDSEVETVFEYAPVSVSYEDGSLTAYVCKDFSVVTNDICYEGKNPAGADEIAVGSAMADKYSIGDKVQITKDNVSYTYTVTGYVQSVNNSGNVCELTNEGYMNISEIEPTSLNVYLKSMAADKFIEKYEAEYKDLISSSIDNEQLAEAGRKLYRTVFAIVIALIFVITILIVLLVLYIIINSMITRRRQEFGIYKAVGWTSRQLVLQTAGSFVPVICISAVISASLGLLYMPAIDNVIFSMIGAMKNHFEVPLWILLVFALVLVIISFIISVILAAPIKKITAYSLLKE